MRWSYRIRVFLCRARILTRLFSFTLARQSAYENTSTLSPKAIQECR